MAYFDTTLELDPITEQQSTPVLPEERYVFELVGFERSEPDEFRKEGGIKWTWRVFEADGRTPFVFNEEQYLFIRTTNIDKKTRKPLFTVGSSANDWASALLGRTLSADAHFQVPELYGKRMSAMVVWKRQKRDASKWSIELASLRHVPTAPAASAPASRTRVEKEAADAAISAMNQEANGLDPDRVFALKKFDRKLAAAKRRKLPSLATFEEGHAAIVDTTTAGEIDALVESLDDALDKLDD
jgi:hypothetical protein